MFCTIYTALMVCAVQNTCGTHSANRFFFFSFCVIFTYPFLTLATSIHQPVGRTTHGTTCIEHQPCC
eukprot:m.134532 g.134532  ORF g.134532 m.134532 type:complete len:67 (-) comp13960_c0_seq1:734-934(-)